MTDLVIQNTPIRLFNGLYSLNDLHKASGGENKHQPAMFLRTDQTKELINEIDRSTDMQIAVKTKKGGKNQGTYVCKELVYAYAMWISAKFHLLVIRTFDTLVNPQHDPHAEYLIFYHEMHDNIKKMVIDQGKEDKENLFHMNYNKLINKAFGIPSGKRQELSSQERVWVSGANSLIKSLVKNCIESGLSYKDTYQVVKDRVELYAASVMVPAISNDIPELPEMTNRLESYSECQMIKLKDIKSMVKTLRGVADYFDKK